MIPYPYCVSSTLVLLRSPRHCDYSLLKCIGNNLFCIFSHTEYSNWIPTFTKSFTVANGFTFTDRRILSLLTDISTLSTQTKLKVIEIPQKGRVEDDSSILPFAVFIMYIEIGLFESLNWVTHSWTSRETRIFVYERILLTFSFHWIVYVYFISMHTVFLSDIQSIIGFEVCTLLLSCVNAISAFSHCTLV